MQVCKMHRAVGKMFLNMLYRVKMTIISWLYVFVPMDTLYPDIYLSIYSIYLTLRGMTAVANADLYAGDAPENVERQDQLLASLRFGLFASRRCRSSFNLTFFLCEFFLCLDLAFHLSIIRLLLSEVGDGLTLFARGCRCFA